LLESAKQDFIYFPISLAGNLLSIAMFPGWDSGLNLAAIEPRPKGHHTPVAVKAFFAVEALF